MFLNRFTSLLLMLNFYVSYSARILCVYNVPSISHQIVFRELTKELARRGHDLVVITTDPYLPKDRPPDNVREIDVSVVYEIFKKEMEPLAVSDEAEVLKTYKVVIPAAHKAFEAELDTPEVKELLNNKSENFDLIILECITRGPLFFTHRFKAPVIGFTSLMGFFYNYEPFGVPVDPVLYPSMFQSKVQNLTFLDKISAVLSDWYERYSCWRSEEYENSYGRKHFGEDTPDIRQLSNNMDLLFVNINPIWDGIRPVPPNIIYLGGLHLQEPKPLVKELQDYLDGCTQGAIYMSLGTNVRSADLPPEKLKIFKKVFSQLPYCVMWKYEAEEMEEKPSNVYFRKWWPQSDVLNHSNVVLFITQGGLQSTEEAVDRGVPLIGIPFLADQNKNANKMEHFGIGKPLLIGDITEDSFRNTILEVIKNESYRVNIARLKRMMYDQPSRPLERAAWWVEYVLRHGGAAHLRAPPSPPTFGGFSFAALAAIAVAVVSVALHVVNLFRIILASRKKVNSVKKKQ